MPSLKVGVGVGGGGKPAPGSEAVFTSEPTIVEVVEGLTVTTGNEEMTVTGVAGFPITATPGQETLSVEIAFP